MIDVRPRRTARLNRARLKLEVRRSVGSALWLVAGLILAVVIVGYFGTKIGATAFKDTYEVRFAVDDATAVTAGVHEIRIKGVRAGKITKVDFESDQPVLTAKVDRKWGAIYRDARAQLRPNTPLQDIYVDVVDRGTPSRGEASGGRPLDAAQTTVAPRIDEVFNTFRPDVRESMRALLDGLGNGLEDRGRSLRTAFVELTPFIKTVSRISEELALRRPQTERLVHNVALLTNELGERDETLRTLVREGATALTAVKDGRADLDALLRELPPTLAAVDSSFAAVRGITADVDEAFEALVPVADRVAPALDDVRRLSAGAEPAVRALQRPVTRLVPLSGALRPLSSRLHDIVRALAPQTDTLNKVTKTLAGCKRGVQGFFQWDASMVKYGDSRGASPRGNLVSGSPAELRAVESCAPGRAIAGRPVKPEDGQ